MIPLSALVLCFLLQLSWSADLRKFPPEFKFGVTTSSYQVEGAWNVSDKGESIWDRLLHTMPELSGGVTGDVACDSYHLWQRDVEMCEELGVSMYRFSISWPRLLPTGFPNMISADGGRYYSQLIDRLLEKGIEPMVTMYHWDLPQTLQDLGGWANPLITDWFADYARVLFTLFGARVKYWLTINEPFVICDMGYRKIWAPYIDDSNLGRYLCNKHVMLAHAKAWRIYDEEFRDIFKGKVSLSTIFVWYEPATPEDAVHTQLTIEHMEGRYSHPVFAKEGGWPPLLETVLNDQAKKEGYPYPRLPPFTDDEKAFVSGTYDFYGLNHYFSRLVARGNPEEPDGWPFYGSQELGVVLKNDPTWKVADADYFGVSSSSLRKQLLWINATYGVSDVLLTENGYVSRSKALNDQPRIDYMTNILNQVLLSIQDGINLFGYTAWSLMDSFEWTSAYSINYGLYAVDFSDVNRARTPRDSALFYSNVTRTRQLL